MGVFFQGQELIVTILLIISLIFSLGLGLFLHPFLQAVWQRLRTGFVNLTTSFEQRYRDYLLNHYQVMHIQGLKSKLPADLKLEQVYQSLQVYQPEVPLAKTAQDQVELLSIGQAMRRSPRLVIVGAAGSGKTTLLFYLSLTYLRRQTDDRLGLDENLLPVFVSLRQLASALEKEGLSLPHYLVHYYAKMGLEPPAGFFSRCLKTGRCLVLLDGLDEVIDQAQRVKVVQWIDAQVARYPNNRFVITSRPVGYETATLKNEFVRLDIQDFTETDIEHFCHNWSLAVEVSLRGEDNEAARRQAETSAQHLLDTLARNRAVRRLAVNPLLLSIIAQVHYSRATLPERRVELYAECVDLLLGGWDEAKGLKRSLSTNQKRAVLQKIALYMHYQKIHELDSRTLNKLLYSFLPTVGDTPEETPYFLREVRDRSSLLVEQRPDSYAFSQLTFQEYLVARELADNGPVSLLLSNAGDEWWHEVTLLYVGMKDATPVVRSLLEIKRADHHNSYAPVLLAGRCLLTAQAIHPQWREIAIKRLEKLFNTGQGQPFMQAGQILARLEGEQVITRFLQVMITGAKERRTAAQEILERLFNGGDEVRRREYQQQLIKEAFDPASDYARPAMRVLIDLCPDEREIWQHPYAVRGLNDLGESYLAQREYSEAQHYFELALKLDQQISAQSQFDITIILYNLGCLFQAQGDLTKADRYFRQVMAIRQEVLGSKHPEVATIMHRLGGLFQTRDDLVKAQAFFEQTLAIRQAVLGPKHPDTMTTLDSLANLFKFKEDYVKSAFYHKQALMIREAVLGADHPETLRSLNDLGQLSFAQGRLEEASQYYQRLLLANQKSGHKGAVGRSFIDLGNAARELGDLERAVEYYEKTLVISREVTDQNMEKQVLDNLGPAYQTLGSIDRAIEAYQQALRIARQNQDQSKIAEILISLGILAHESQMFDRTKEYWLESRKIYEHNKSPLISSVNALLDKLAATQANLFSLQETAQFFFQAAGFHLEFGRQNNVFLCQAKDKTWQNRFTKSIFSQPVPVEIVSDAPLDQARVLELFQSASEILTAKPATIFVVVNNTPTDSGWLQIATMRAEGVQIIPIDDILLFDGQEQGRQQQILEKHLRRFLGRKRDLYNVRDPVADRLNFFGREVLADEVAEDLIKGHPVALFGLRKMGKSSLLKFLRDRLPFPTAYVDLQTGIEPASLYDRILTSWRRSLKVKIRDLDWSPPDWTPEPGRGFDFSTAFVSATHHLLALLEECNLPPRLALLVDEADLIMPYVTDDPERYLTVARTLRGLTQEDDRFALLVAGVDTSLNRKNRLAGQQNPFYQFFREIYLPSLNREDCIQMIRNIGRQMGLVYSSEAASFVADISGGYPFFARQLCSLAFQHADGTSTFDLSHLQEMTHRFISEPATSELLRGLWEEAQDPALWSTAHIIENQTLLKSLAQAEPQAEEKLASQAQDRRAFEHALEELKLRAMLSQAPKDRFQIRLRLFRIWIRRYALGKE